MPRKSLDKFQVIGSDVHISREKWDKIALTTFREDYYAELTSRTWTLSKDYLVNKKFGSLHRYIMGKWYGENVLTELTAKGYVVDHMNNDGMDCRISNLEFLKKGYNTAKGQTFDIDGKKLKYQIAVNIFKDFTTGCYQISIGCNDTIYGTDPNGNKFCVNKIKLLYDCDYSIVVNDAENILLIYETEGIISTNNTNACDTRITKAPEIALTDEEKKGSVVFRDGVPYLVLGTGNTYIVSSHYDEGWLPSPKKY